jgi:hypothetical protein
MLIWATVRQELPPMRFRQVAEKVFSQCAYIGYNHNFKKAVKKISHEKSNSHNLPQGDRPDSG